MPCFADLQRGWTTPSKNSNTTYYIYRKYALTHGQHIHIYCFDLTQLHVPGNMSLLRKLTATFPEINKHNVLKVLKKACSINEENIKMFTWQYKRCQTQCVSLSGWKRIYNCLKLPHVLFMVYYPLAQLVARGI